MCRCTCRGYFEEGGGFSPLDAAIVLRCPDATLSTAAPVPTPPRSHSTHSTHSTPPADKEVAWHTHAMLQQWPGRVAQLLQERLGNAGAPHELSRNPEAVVLQSSVVVYRSCYPGEALPDAPPRHAPHDAHAYLACQPWVFGHPLHAAAPDRTRYTVQLGFVPVCGVDVRRAKAHANTMAGADVAWVRRLCRACSVPLPPHRLLRAVSLAVCLRVLVAAACKHQQAPPPGWAFAADPALLFVVYVL